MNNIRGRVVILTGPGFEDVEVIYPYYRMQEAGFAVDVSTSNDTEVFGKYGVPVQPTLKKKDLSVDDFDAVIIPGGNEAPDRVRQEEHMVSFVHDMYQAGKVVSSVCHGPWVLIEASVVRGKKTTCYKGMKTDLINAGATYTGDPVVVDGRLVTADHPRSLGAWMRETLKLL